MKHAGTFTNIIKLCWFLYTSQISTSQHSLTHSSILLILYYYFNLPTRANLNLFLPIWNTKSHLISSNKETELMRNKAPSGNTKRRRPSRVMVKGTLSTHFMVQLDQASLKPSRFHNPLDSKPQSDSMPLDFDADDKDFILSQDFFWSKFILFSSLTIWELSV